MAYKAGHGFCRVWPLPGGARLRLLNVEQYLALPRPEIDWIVPEHIPKPSTVLLLGEPKAGKSFLALQVAYAVARGTTVLGRPVTRPGPVLYLQFDTSELVWRNRFQKLKRAKFDLSGPVIMPHPDDNMRVMNVLDPAVRAWWKEALSCKPQLVVIDVLREIHNSDEDSSTQMKKVFSALKELLGDYAVLIVHHTPKIPKDFDSVRIINLARGSSYIAGAVDALWLLHNHHLWIIPRFAEEIDGEAVRQRNGLFTFPDLEKSEALAGLCDQYPALTHSQIASIAEKQHGITRSAYYRFLATHVCCHTEQAPLEAALPEEVPGPATSEP